ncbi:protein FAR-RED ELONGATED HYPOCOTYL 1 [Heracleum sosnowskyi]|uniref:Protein FAR-RED ELONGATED HYPOCOTYL 1 n=1 Tax=Heracleum sosnowskyi TaxID=360622 RepID=A0AAD8HFX6_9APIA|nr:protein FAR-RED ELONGATED HYPOCOTYL 1 [Heracleum sosnowskyi]
MEEDCYDPSEITSVEVDNVLHASVIFMNKKRKIQVEQLDLPLPKHNCCKRGITSELGSPSTEIPKESVCAVLIAGIIHREEKDSESELESGNGSNSFAEDDDSIMSESDGTKSETVYLKMLSVNCTSTPVNQTGVFDKGAMFSLDSRVTKSSADKGKSPCTDYENPHHHIGSLASLHDEHFSEYEEYDEYGCLDYGDDSIQQYKQLKLLCASSGNSENLFLSVNNQDAENQPAAEKLTIDKEFEEYFSNLMI